MAPHYTQLFVLLLLSFSILWFSQVQSAFQQDISYLKLVKDAQNFCPEDNYYDYIVVGGGTAGCPLAATLSENFKVLLIERGADAHSNPNVILRENILNNILQINDVDSPAQRFTSEDGIPNIRGRVLGGGSMVNFGLYSRGDEVFYNRSGINWDVDMRERAYEWVEETVVFRTNQLNPFASSVKEALLQSGITPDNGFTLEHVEGTKITGATFDANGRRHGSVQHLNKANTSNLQVIVNATVEKLLFSSPTQQTGNGNCRNFPTISAVGVIYKDRKGKSHQVHVRKNGEVILSAGTLGSPQLLLLSGVGPSSYLSYLNIHVVYHQPFVGQFMIDPPLNAVNFISSYSFSGSGDYVVGIPKDGSSIIEILSADVPFYSPVSPIFFPYPYAPLNLTLLSVFAKTERPMSNGSLKLASARNVSITPIVRFNHFANPNDISHCVRGMQIVGKVIRNPIMDQFKFENKDGEKYSEFVGYLLPENLSDRDQMGGYCRKTLATYYHYHGGCTMQKVTDTDFKVIGIKALRVVDSSTFVVSPGTNPQATLMMLGRYVGLKIMEERAGGLAVQNVSENYIRNI